MKPGNWRFFAGFCAGAAFAIAALVAVWFLIVFGVERHAEHGHAANEALSGMLRPPPVPSGSVFELDWTLRSLDGEAVSLADLEDRVVFVNLWATWCPPCVVEMPRIRDLMAEVPSTDVAWLLVTEEPAEVVRPFVEEQEWELPIVLSEGEIPELLRSRSLPTTLIVDRAGRIAFRHIGAADWADTASVRFLTGLLDD